MFRSNFFEITYNICIYCFLQNNINEKNLWIWLHKRQTRSEKMDLEIKRGLTISFSKILFLSTMINKIIYTHTKELTATKNWLMHLQLYNVCYRKIIY